MYCSCTDATWTQTTSTSSNGYYTVWTTVTTPTSGTLSVGVPRYIPAVWDRVHKAFPPAWWRWFDIFRTFEPPKLLQLLEGVPNNLKRIQERFPMSQRRRSKRRKFVQSLARQPS